MTSHAKVPKHIVSVCACVRNPKGEILLVKTHHRSDTWELPGGQVEEKEALDHAVEREVLEETGIKINARGITGVYYNATSSILCVTFCADYIEGEINKQDEEILAAQFVKLDETTIDNYITRPNMKSRALDALHSPQFVPYETWKVRPNQLLGRLDIDSE